MLKDQSIRKMAIMATKHCLIGCGIGEILGMVIGTAANMSNFATTLTAVALAFVFGYSFTYFPLVSRMGRRSALKTALTADTVSITSMEIIDNAFIWIVPGAIHATLSDVLFWASLLLSLLIAFVLTVPVNYWMISRGKGHAVVHASHGSHH